MNVTRSSDQIYTYQTMRKAFNAGYDRKDFELAGFTEPKPNFETFMREEFNDPRCIDWVVSYRITGDEKDHTFEVQSRTLDEAAAVARMMMNDVAFVRFDVRQKCYED